MNLLADQDVYRAGIEYLLHSLGTFTHRSVGQPTVDETAIHLRHATEDDAQALARVHFSAVMGTGAASYSSQVLRGWTAPPDAPRVERFRQTIASGAEIFTIAEVGGQVRGFGSIVASAAELRSLYVDPEVGRRGVGHALLIRLEQMARERGLSMLTMNASINAEAFYRRHGYEVVSRATHSIAPNVDMACVKMKKTIMLEQNG